MNTQIKKSLTALQADYEKVHSKRFTTFFCPIKYEDAPVRLCMGHVVNKAIGGSSNARIVQRQDVDNFYGSLLESEYTGFLETRGKSFSERVNSKSHYKGRVKFILNGKEVSYHRFHGEKRDDQSIVYVKESDRIVAHLAMHLSPAALIEASKSLCESVVERDCRIAALAAMIKAAHLTLFSLLGYTYVNTAASYFIGRLVLGRFFDDYRMTSPMLAREAAKTIFVAFTNVMRPVLGNHDFKGTIDDRKAIAVHGGSGRVFALGIMIRIGTDTNCVLVPNFGADGAVDTYFHFLENSNQEITVTEVTFDPEKGCWSNSKDASSRIQWPKNDEDFVYD